LSLPRVGQLPLVARRSDRFGIRPRANRARFGTRNLAILPNIRIATAEIALFILLPRVPLLLMLLVFVPERDFRFVFLAAVELTMIVLSIVLECPT